MAKTESAVDKIAEGQSIRGRRGEMFFTGDEEKFKAYAAQHLEPADVQLLANNGIIAGFGTEEVTPDSPITHDQDYAERRKAKAKRALAEPDATTGTDSQRAGGRPADGPATKTPATKSATKSAKKSTAKKGGKKGAAKKGTAAKKTAPAPESNVGSASS